MAEGDNVFLRQSQIVSRLLQPVNLIELIPLVVYTNLQ